MESYGYKKEDVGSMPTLTVPYSPGILNPPPQIPHFPKGTRIIMRYSLMTRAEKKGTDPLATIAGHYQGDIVPHWTKGNTGVIGCMKSS